MTLIVLSEEPDNQLTLTEAQVDPAPIDIITTQTPGPPGPPGQDGVAAATAPLTYDPDTHTVGIEPNAYDPYGAADSALQAAQDYADAAVAGSGQAAFQFTQDSPESVWTIVHNMNTTPSVTIRDSANEVIWGGDIDYVDSNTLTISFGAPFSGAAYLV